jgi:hypothetical protein
VQNLPEFTGVFTPYPAQASDRQTTAHFSGTIRLPLMPTLGRETKHAYRQTWKNRAQWQMKVFWSLPQTFWQ